MRRIPDLLRRQLRNTMRKLLIARRTSVVGGREQPLHGAEDAVLVPDAVFEFGGCVVGGADEADAP